MALKESDGTSSGINPVGPSAIDIVRNISDYAIWGDTAGGFGVVGTSRTGPGVFGNSKGEPAAGVGGQAGLPAPGVVGVSTNGTGVHGVSLLAAQPAPDVFADGGIGVAGENNLQGGIGVDGKANGPQGTGVRGQANDVAGVGVRGT